MLGIGDKEFAFQLHLEIEGSCLLLFVLFVLYDKLRAQVSSNHEVSIGFDLKTGGCDSSAHARSHVVLRSC